MTVIAYSEIPEYLHSSAFYCSLSNENETDEIEVPDDCFKADDRVLDSEDFRTLLKVIMFWGLDKIPLFVIVWCCDHPLGEWEDSAKEILGEESTLLADLRHIFDLDAPHARFQRAVEANQPDILEVLVKDSTTDQKCTEGVTEAAARLGHLAMLKVLHDHRFFWDEQVCIAAAGAGHLVCLQYAVENGCDWDEGTCRAAARCGHLECLKYAYEHQCPWDASVGQQAAANGHAECLRYVIETDPDISTDDYTDTLQNGHIECLKVLQAFHYPWNEQSIAIAASYGHLQCVVYLREECACVWDENVPLWAAEENILPVLQYALEHDCPCEDDLLLITAHADSLECMQYLLNERFMHMDEELFAAAFNNASVQCVQYLLDGGCPYEGSEFTGHPDFFYLPSVNSDKYDVRLLECIKLVCAAGWVVNDELCRFVEANRFELPRCVTYLQDGNFIRW